MDFSLNETRVMFAGALVATVPNPGAADFVALYDEYRLDLVEISFMFGANTVSAGSVSSAMLPIINVVFDPSDTSVITIGSILQYQNVQTVQLGNTRTQNGYVMSFKPVPAITAGGATASLIPTNPVWLTADAPTVRHNALKLVYDAAGSIQATQIGTLTMYIKYHWSCKLSH